MGAFNDIFSEVKERLGGRSTIDNRITRWINDAYFDILMTPQFYFHELDTTITFVTSPDVRNYTVIPFLIISDFWFIISMRDDTNEREIRKKDIKTFDRIAHTTGQPVRYARYAGGIDLDPTPDGTYNITMRYRIRPGELSTGAVTVIGREWDEPLTLLSVVKGYEALEQPNKAEKNFTLYMALLGKREEQMKLEDDDKEPTIGPWLNEDLP